MLDNHSEQTEFLFGPKVTYMLAELQQYEPVKSAWTLRSFVGNSELG